MSRGRIVIFSGFFAIAAATAALAQSTPAAQPEPAAKPAAASKSASASQPTPAAKPAPAMKLAPHDFDVKPFEYDVPDFADVAQAIEQAREVMSQDHRAALERARQAAEDMRLKGFDGYALAIPDADWALSIKGDLDLARDQMKALKADGKLFKFETKGLTFAAKDQNDLARMFERCDREKRGDDLNEQEDRFYDCGRRAIDEGVWDRAVDFFGRAAAVKGGRADGALYWKAYSQNRLGQRAEALSTLAELKSGFAKSRWTNDANALEVEVRQRAGQKVDPALTQDDELKLIALNALGDSPEAVPMLERLLSGPQSPKLKERALFVLAQNQNPAARAVVVKVAKGGGNPELQLRAVQYVGRTRTPESREVLAQVYTTAADASVKRMIIRTYMEAQDRERLVGLARTETDAPLRMEAVRQLGNMKAGAELVEIYSRETSPEIKKTILRSMANGGSIDRLVAVADTEKDPELKRTAIRALGVNRDTAPHLVNFYTKDANVEVRKAVIDALFTQGNAAALVTIARKETDIELRKSIINRLGNMRENAEAKAYLIELLK
jgi:hypothetical protein